MTIKTKMYHKDIIKYYENVEKFMNRHKMTAMRQNTTTGP